MSGGKTSDPSFGTADLRDLPHQNGDLRIKEKGTAIGKNLETMDVMEMAEG